MNTQSNLLRNSLKANGIFSTLSGTGFIIAANPIAEFIGLDYPLIITTIGISLLIFAVGLFLNAFRETINTQEAKIAIALDIGWVLGSAIIIPLSILNTNGNWATAIIADIVLILAIMQFIGVRRLLKSQLHSTPRSPQAPA